MSRTLPAPKDVRDLLDELLGRSVTVRPVEPLRSAELHEMLVSLYVDDGLKLSAVVGMTLPLAVYAGAALGLIPAAGAQGCIDERELTPMIAENVTEVCNVLSTLLNGPGLPAVRMYQTYVPGQKPPTDAAGFLLALGRRLDLTIEVSGYGTGKLAIVLAN